MRRAKDQIRKRTVKIFKKKKKKDDLYSQVQVALIYMNSK